MDFDIWFISVDQPSMLKKSLAEPDIALRILQLVSCLICQGDPVPNIGNRGNKV